MKKIKKLLPALLAALLLLTACGGSSSGSVSMDSSKTESATTDSADGGDRWLSGWAADNAAPMEPEMPAPAPEVAPETEEGQAPSLPADAKLIYSADLSLESKDFEAAAEALDRAVADLGGYYERHSVDQGGSRRSLSCTVRVPAARFEDLLEQAGQLAHATSCYQYTENVSEAYYDTEARLKTQETKRERLLTLLESAATMEDIIALESALSDTELQIEYLTGSLRHYDSLIGYSTVNINLYEVYKLSTDQVVPETFGQRIGRAFSLGFSRGVDALEDFTVFLAMNWMGILLLAAAACAVVVVIRRRRRRKIAPPAASGKDETPKT